MVRKPDYWMLAVSSLAFPLCVFLYFFYAWTDTNDSNSAMMDSEATKNELKRTEAIIAAMTEYSRTTEPNEHDSLAYIEAYGLIFNSNERAKAAAKLLLDDGKRSLSDLSPKELWLLYRAYNELSDREKQLAPAQVLWDKYPDFPQATGCIVNAMASKLYDEDGPAAVNTFLESALTEKKGRRSELLMLKVKLLLLSPQTMTDSEKRVAISDILVDVHLSNDLGLNGIRYPDADFSHPNFIDRDWNLTSFFSLTEREEIKLKMQKAKLQQTN